MKLASFEAIVAALEDAGVRYLVAGGLAVNAHGYSRVTFDVDLVVQLDRGNVVPTFRALATLGYRPMVPVTAEQFADSKVRQTWIEGKGMKVLNFKSELHALTAVDVFVTEPFDFEEEYNSALIGEVSRGLFVRFVSLPTLIAMKKAANRPLDLVDIQHLLWVQEELGKGIHEP